MGHADGPQAQDITIAVFYAPETGEPDLREVRLPAGATAEQAVLASGLRAAHPELVTLDVRWGVDGQRVLPHHILQEGDRIDLCRPLQVDPMSARRLRAAAAKKAAASKPRF
ncbi:MAG: RnfH family protein [Thiomonas sp. 20-64-5]|nr:MAG: RnfH family protein [Thiomonas sp. 20-64-5]